MKVWIITGHSESSDRGEPVAYDHIPTDADKKDYIEYMFGEELDVDGPGDFGSYVYLTITYQNGLMVKDQKLCS